MSLPRVSLSLAVLLATVSLSAHAALPMVAAAPIEPVRSFGAAGLLQAGFGLAAVLGLIFLCGWAARRFGLQQQGGGRLLKVVASAAVGQRERVVVVEIGDSWLVLGVAPNQVRTLHTMPIGKTPTFETNLPQLGISLPGAFSQKLMESLHSLNLRPKRD